MVAKRKQGPRTDTAMLSLSFVFGDAHAPPSEFRIFSMGINPSEKGDFLFDERAAASVMMEYQRHGKPMLLDFNHGTTFKEPTPEQAIAAGEFIPEVRADGLYATQIQWTPRAETLLRAKEYRLFSPFFEHDKQTGRVLRLINCALTNLPALDGIAPLVAASATTGDDEMETCTACSALTAKLTKMEEECSALRASLSAFQEKEEEKASAVALRANVFAITGKSDTEGALGVLQALRASTDDLARVKGQLEAEQTAKLSADFAGALNQACKDGKIPPAQRALWEGFAKEDGHAKALARLTAFAETAVVVAPGRTVEAPTATVALSAIEQEIAARTGSSVEGLRKYKEKKFGGAA